MTPKRTVSYWFTSVYENAYSNMQIWYRTLRLEIRFMTHDIELVQNSAMHFISNLKRRTDSVSKAKQQLQLQSLKDRRRNHQVILHQLRFLTQIFQNEDQHHTPSTAHDGIARDTQLVTVTTREAGKGEPISISTKESIFHTSFLL